LPRLAIAEADDLKSRRVHGIGQVAYLKDHGATPGSPEEEKQRMSGTTTHLSPHYTRTVKGCPARTLSTREEGRSGGVCEWYGNDLSQEDGTQQVAETHSFPPRGHSHW
jgi:hypothetical protein